MVIFRENTEDIYAASSGGESEEAKKVIAFLENEMDVRKIGSRPRAVSASSPSRAREPSVSCARPSLTRAVRAPVGVLVHKGNT